MLVANRHAGAIIFPRILQGVIHAPVIIHPGTVEEVDDEFWATLKKSPVIQYYLDQGHICEVKTEKPVAVTEERTSDPPIPEHLQDESQEQPSSVASGVKAKVRRTKTATVEVG